MSLFPITPEWYLLPSFGILRSVTLDLGIAGPKTLGLAVLCAAFLAPLSLAFYRWSTPPWPAWATLVLIAPVIFGLGWVGAHPSVSAIGPALTIVYFAIFAVVPPALASSRK